MVTVKQDSSHEEANGKNQQYRLGLRSRDHYRQHKGISDLPVCCIIGTSDETCCTLEVGDHDLCVVGASEQVVCSRGEPNRPHIAAVRPVHLDDSSSSDVIQHARTVFLSRC